jgi:hypothetical protein
VQRAWSEIMNVLANPKGSVGRWNMNFWSKMNMAHNIAFLGLIVYHRICGRHLLMGQILTRGQTNKGSRSQQSEVILGHIAQVQTYHYTSAKEKS